MRRSMRAAAAATAMLLLAGCAHDAATPAGNDLTDLPAATVVERSLAAFKSAPSYRVEVHGGDANKRLSIKLAVVGANLHGSLTRDGGTTEILKAGTNFYIRPDETFWATEPRSPSRPTPTPLSPAPSGSRSSAATPCSPPRAWTARSCSPTGPS
jgi:hypothetical protein